MQMESAIIRFCIIFFLFQVHLYYVSIRAEFTSMCKKTKMILYINFILHPNDYFVNFPNVYGTCKKRFYIIGIFRNSSTISCSFTCSRSIVNNGFKSFAINSGSINYKFSFPSSTTSHQPFATIKSSNTIFVINGSSKISTINKSSSSFATTISWFINSSISDGEKDGRKSWSYFSTTRILCKDCTKSME